MRLLVGTDFFYPHWTGISKSLGNLVQLLARDLRITVATVRYDHSLPAEEEWHGVRVVRDSYLFSLSRCCYSVLTCWRFLRELPRVDTVLLNSPCSNILCFAFLAKLFKRRLIIYHQGDLILPEGYFNRMVEAIFTWHTKWALSLADAACCFTDDYAEHSRVLKSVLDKHHACLMPVLLPELGDSPGRVSAKLLELKSAGRVLIGFAGRFVEEKGFDLLFRAIPDVVAVVPEAHFVFAGETAITYETTYEDCIRKIEPHRARLTLLGLLDGSDLREFYEGIDLFVLPSRSECFALVQAEAALCDTPVVVSDIPGARVLVRTTGYGEIFESENSADLAEKLIAALGKREEYRSRVEEVRSFLDPALAAEKMRLVLEGQ